MCDSLVAWSETMVPSTMLHLAAILCFWCVLLLLIYQPLRSARPQNLVSSMPNIHREERGIPSPTLV